MGFSEIQGLLLQSRQKQADALRKWLGLDDRVSQNLQLPGIFKDDVSVSSSLEAEAPPCPSTSDVEDDVQFDAGSDFLLVSTECCSTVSPELNATHESHKGNVLFGTGSIFCDLSQYLDASMNLTISSPTADHAAFPIMRSTQPTILAFRGTSGIDYATPYKGPVLNSGPTGSETESSSAGGSKWSKETDSTVDSSTNGDHRACTWPTNGEGAIELGPDVDRLAIHLSKETIELCGKATSYPVCDDVEQQSSDTSLSINISGVGNVFTNNAEEIAGNDLSILRSNAEIITPSSNTKPSDTTSEDWLSDIVEDLRLLESGHSLMDYKGEALLLAMQRLRDYVQVHRCTLGVPGGHEATNQSSESGSSGHNGSERKRRKISDLGDGDGDGHGNGGSPLPPKDRRSKDVQGGSEQNKKHLACPFYKLDNIRYIRCVKFGYDDIKRVKQHLRRNHLQPQFYCSVCYEIFDKATTRDTHIRLRTCLQRERPDWDGISDDLCRAFRQKVQGESLEDQWFSVWDLIFPGVARPKSAFVQGQLEEVMDMVREFWVEEGDQIITSILTRDDLSSHQPLPSDATDLTNFSRQMVDVLIAELLDQFSKAIRTRLAAYLPNSTSTTGGASASLTPFEGPGLITPESNSVTSDSRPPAPESVARPMQSTTNLIQPDDIPPPHALVETSRLSQENEQVSGEPSPAQGNTLGPGQVLEGLNEWELEIWWNKEFLGSS